MRAIVSCLFRKIDDLKKSMCYNARIGREEIVMTIVLIAGYWRVMKDRKLVATFRTYRQAEAYRDAHQ